MLNRSVRSIGPTKMLLGLGSALGIALTSCTATPTTDSVATPEDGGEESSLQVVTTFLPITQFTQAVVGDRATVTQILPGNAGPHDFQAKPGDLQAITNADVLVQNGLGLEFFLDDLIANADNPEMVIIDSSEGIETLEFETSHSDGAHDHGAEKEEEHDEDAHEEEGHDHEAHGEEEHDEDAHEEEGHDEGHDEKAHNHEAHGSEDPHIWLDPKRAVEQVENIRDGLIAADPDGEAVYTENAEAYIAQLQDLDAEISEQLAPYAGQTFISFHDFAAYFAESYDLNVEFLVDVPDTNPSPEDMRRVIETVEAENIKALLTEPSVGESGFSALSEDLDVQVGVFDPVATGDPALQDSDYYFSTMLQNVENLQQALRSDD